MADMTAVPEAAWRRPFVRLLMDHRRPVVVVVHMLLVAAANYLAFWLRFEGVIPEKLAVLARTLVPALVLIRVLTFIPFKLYQGVWRYTSVGDLRDILAAVGISSAAFYLLVRWGLGLASYPRSIFIIDALLLVCFMGGVRMVRRLLAELGRPERGKRVLIYGAGDAGEMIARDMQRKHFDHYVPVGFVDDDRRKVGGRIHGLRVLGTREELPSILAATQPDEVLIAMPSAKAAHVRRIVSALEPHRLAINTVPNLRDIFDGRVTVAQIRPLAIEDLLPRAPVGLDPRPVERLIAGRSVMVTGAGGSIGSEMCRQIAALRPKALLLFERYENTLFDVANELLDKYPAAAIHPIVGDVADWNRVAGVMAAHRPEVVFHAAAHKHVPLMEQSPCEAVKNNVAGTWVLSQAAKQAGVERVVLISTDKAVNPTSVMGATKRVAELIVQAMAASKDGSVTTFTAVRFGNVLGSNGSVVPRFLGQIRAGGPVTVTDPQIKRYFMLIPEAVQLVLHAAALAKGGEVFVLDMGEQIRILDLARNLIRLSGLVPEQDIAIQFTGLRPGEKLFEELVGQAETAERLSIDKILRVRGQVAPKMSVIQEAVQELHRVAVQGDVAAALAELSALVPTFQPRLDVLACTWEVPSSLESPLLAQPVLFPSQGGRLDNREGRIQRDPKEEPVHAGREVAPRVVHRARSSQRGALAGR